MECGGGLLRLLASKRQNVMAVERWRICRVSIHISTTDLSRLIGPPFPDPIRLHSPCLVSSHLVKREEG